MKPSLDREQRLYDALKRISSYQSVETLQKHSQRDWGLPYEEALEYAYENILHEAKHALKGMRRPVAVYTQAELDAAKRRANKIAGALQEHP